MIALLAALLSASPSAAAQLLQAGRTAEAVPLLEKALREHPRDARVANDLGSALDRLGRREEAEAAYRRAIRLDPARFPAYGNLTSMLAQAPDRWDRADEVLALMGQGLARARAPDARLWLAIRVAGFERAVGRTSAARGRLEALQEARPGPAHAQQIRDLLDRIELDERARALEDWPEPALTPAQEEALRMAERQLAAGDARGALLAAERIRAAEPSSRPVRRLAAHALESLGRIDEAARELRVVTQLAPSDAPAWRKLGEILGEHGGLLEADLADEALQQALSLEPAWTSLWLLRARLALRQGRPRDALRHLERLERAGAAGEESLRLQATAKAQEALSPAAKARPRGAREPSPQARQLLQEARDLGSTETPDRTRERIARALDDSPGFIEAAAALVAIGGTVPASTVEALSDDGPALLELAAQVRRANGPLTAIAPLIDRAVALEAPEARWFRALLRFEQLDRSGTLDDLVAYAAQPQPLRLAEARALRSRLLPPPRIDGAPLEARLRLLEGRPEAAIAALGTRCAAGVPAPRLLALGRVHEYAAEPGAAFSCYRLAAQAGEVEGLRRLSRLGARVVDPSAAPELEVAVKTGIPEAHWALARIALQAGHAGEALGGIARFLAAAAPDEPLVPEAIAARDRILRTSSAAADRRFRLLAAAAGCLALVAMSLFRLRGGASVARAVRLAPLLYPVVARAASELRHDVVKHRANVLGMLAEPGTRRADVARALSSPESAAAVVARRYAQLRTAARGQGITLRRLARDPVFGPFARDLSRAEKLLASPSGGERELAAIDRRIRETHAARLASLLKLAPRTCLDAGAVTGWIRDVEAELRRGGERRAPPSLLVQGPGLAFPVEESVLSTIFANLLRNAWSAAGANGHVIVRVGEERDAAGRKLMTLLVGDSAPHAISIETIEQRESGRGLAIVRDLTREWQGHLTVREEEAPWTKAVGACFPAPAA